MKNLNKILAIIAVAIIGVAIVMALLPSDTEPVEDQVVIGDPDPPEPPKPFEPSKVRSQTTTGTEVVASPGVGSTTTLVAEATTTTTTVAEKPRLLRTEDELREAIFSNDAAAREEALSDLAGLLERGEGKKLIEEMILSGSAENDEEVIALMPNLPEGERLPLIDLALDSASPEFRAEALSLLRDVVGFDVNNLLIKGMKDTDPEVLEEAGDLLVYFDDHPIYEAAWAGLTHANQEVRENAFGYFEDSHTGPSISYLIEALRMQNPYPEVAPEMVGDALRFITDADHIETNDYESWAAWFREFGQEWIDENDPPDEEIPTPATSGGGSPQTTGAETPTDGS